MKIEILLPSNPIELLEKVIENEKIELKSKTKISNDLYLTYEGSTAEQGFSPGVFHELLEVTLSYGTTIAVGILTNFIYDLVKNKASKLWIDSKQVNLDKEEIEKVVQDYLEKNSPTDDKLNEQTEP